jgi:transcriptional regulator with XRE-family HTH domain
MSAVALREVIKSRLMTPGDRLRGIREKLDLTLKDVEIASTKIAAERENPDFGIPASRLSEIEIRGFTPSIYRLHSLAIIYGKDIRELMELYGVDFDRAPSHSTVVNIRNTHTIASPGDALHAFMPVSLDPGFDPAQSANLTRLVEQWGPVPMQLLAHLPRTEYLYGYVGLDDWTMWPLVKPGAFLQVDKKLCQVQSGPWASEHDRPIYFVETREGYTCCWCALEAGYLVLQSHPLSPIAARVLRNRHDANVIGTVVGIAQRLEPARTPYAAVESASAKLTK